MWELESDPDISITVLSGSLFAGERSGPISAYPHIPSANSRISDLTGVIFGPDYEALLAEGSFILDSEAASRGLVALKSIAGPGRDLEMAGAMQVAFYRDGLSLSAPSTYARIAENHGLDAASVLRALMQQEVHDTASFERDRLAEWGIQSYSTLLLAGPDTLTKIGSPTSSAARLRSVIDKHQ